MNFANKLLAPWVLYVASIMILPAAGCGQTIVSAKTPTTSSNTPGIGQNTITLPRAWLIIGDQQVAGTLAAGGTRQGHFDPALTFPNIKTGMLPAEAKAVITIDSNLLQNITVTVRPWRRDGTIIPLLDDSARRLKIESQNIGNSTSIALEAVGNSDDQLLNVNVTFKDGWGFYLWRLNPKQ